MHVREEDLNGLFDHRYLDRGHDYAERGMVIQATSHDGLSIQSRVRGSGRKSYQQQIHLEFAHERLIDVHGNCSCPVNHNCKHVIAALLHFIRTRPPEQSELFGSTTDEWVDQLQAANKPPAIRKESLDHLLYLLNFTHYPTGRRLHVSVIKTRRLADGSYSKPSWFALNPSSHHAFVQEVDKQIMLLLQSMNKRNMRESPLVGSTGDIVLRMMIDTGRCHWQKPTYPPLEQAEKKLTTLSWQFQADGSQTIEADNLPPHTVLLPVIPPRYLLTSGACGELNCDLPERLAAVLVASPPVAPDAVAALCKAMQESFPQQDLPLPVMPDINERNNILPQPWLRLYSHCETYVYRSQGQEEWDTYADLHFEYNGIAIHPMSEEKRITHKVDEKFEVIERNIKAEKAIIDQLYDIGLVADELFTNANALTLSGVHESQTWLDFMIYQRQHLEQLGWQIEVDEDFLFHVEETENWVATLSESSGEDWFSLGLDVEVQGQRVNLLPMLVTFLSQFKNIEQMEEMRQLSDDEYLLFRQPNNHILKIPMGKVRHIIDTLVELYDPNILDNNGQLKLSRYQSSQLATLDNIETQLTWEGGKTLRTFGERLRNFDGIKEVKPPATLKAELRDYQREGLNWLQFLREYELGGILADDMGLGKTVQALAHLLIEKKAGRADRPSLVVAPTSLMVNWRREAQRFAPSLKVLTLQGAQRKQRFTHIAGHDLVLTTYPLLSRDAEVLCNQQWHVVILDEAQYIKNPKSKAAQMARDLRTRHRLCLTGTPMENHLGELWSQFHFLMPGILGDQKQFTKLFRNPIEKHNDAPRQQQLRQRVAPFMLRRDKSEVATELPPKTEIITEVELSGPQRDLYETIRVAMHDKVRREIDKKGIERSQIIILDALLKLRQVCCHPQLLKMAAAKKVTHSAKMDQLMELLPEMVEEGRRILLFSQFTSMLSLIEAELKKHKLGYVKLTGQTRNREKPIDDFQAGKAPIFLISLKAGGAGLNLTAADTVIHYDPWWNPAAERQATDRAYRIGQDKPVFVYKMITESTVEEKIAEMQTRKQALADALFSENSKDSKISSDDLRALFDPLK